MKGSLTGTTLFSYGISFVEGRETSGRASSLALNPSNALEVFLGTASAGLWLTEDLQTWTQIFSDSPAIGAVVVEPGTCAPSGTVPGHCTELWVGTGEGFVRRETFGGNGLYHVTFFPGGGGEFNDPRWIAERVAGSDSVTGGGIGEIALTGAAGARAVYFTVTAGNIASANAATVHNPPPSGGYGVFRYDATAKTMTRESVPPNEGPTVHLPGDLVFAQTTAGGALFATFFNRGIYRRFLTGAQASAQWCPLSPGAPPIAGCPTPLSGCPAGASLPPKMGMNRFDHVHLAVAPSNNDVLYASFADCSAKWSANEVSSNYDCTATLFRSTDGGTCWSDMQAKANTDDQRLRTYSAYTGALVVSPFDSNDLTMEGLLQYRTTSPQGPFNVLFSGQAHPDNHDAVYSPFKWSPDTQGFKIDPNGNLQLVYAVNDGGFGYGFFSATGDTQSWSDANRLPTVETYSVGSLPRKTCTNRPGIDDDCNGAVDDVPDECAAPDQCNTQAVMAGTQDNGTLLFNGGRAWAHLTSADVGDVFPLTKTQGLIEYYNIPPARISTTQFTLGLGAVTMPTGANSQWEATVRTGHGKVFQPPLRRSRVTGKIYLGSDTVYEGDPAANAFTAISPTLITSNGTCTGDTDMNPRGNCPAGSVCNAGTCRRWYPDIGMIDGVSAIGVSASPTDPDRLYVGLYDGAFWRRQNGTWTEITSIPTKRACDEVAIGAHTPFDDNGVANGTRCAAITSIEVAPDNVDRVYVTVTGANLTGQHFWVYNNAANQWSSTELLDGELTGDIQPMVIRADPKAPVHLLLGTHIGLFERTATQAWKRVTDIPAALPVYGIDFDDARGRTFVATHGRGVYMHVDNPEIHVFEGWMPADQCPQRKPCFWDVLVYGEGFQSTTAACTVELLTANGDVCITGTVDPFSGTSIGVSADGHLAAKGQLVAKEAEGKAVIAACFNGNCVGNHPKTDCEPDATHPDRRLASVRVLCPNNNQVIASVGARCPQLVNPPATDWSPDKAITGAPPPAGGGSPNGTITLAATTVAEPMLTLCGVTVANNASDSVDDLLTRARDAMNASSQCQAAGVTAELPVPDSVQEDKGGDRPTLRLRAPGISARSLFLSVESSATQGRLCQRFGNFPGYATNQLDLVDVAFSTPPTGALGGSVSFTQISPLGVCTINVPTSPGDNATTIAGRIFDAYHLAYTTDTIPTCPYVANPGDLTLTGSKLITIASTAAVVCSADAGVGMGVHPEGSELCAGDVTPPVIRVASATATINVCKPKPQVVNIPLPQVTDNCIVPPSLIGQVIQVKGVTLSPPLPIVNGSVLLPLGSHRIRWTATDLRGKTSTQDQTITVTVSDTATTCCPAGSSVIVGDEGPNNIVPTVEQSYCVIGKGGADYVLTRSGNDYILGGTGADYLNAATGSDVVIGGDGDDFLYGTGSRFEGYGGKGADSIFANFASSAELWGGGDGDNIVGSPGPDLIVPGGGIVSVDAGAGNDTIQLFDVCEAVSGLHLDGGNGNDTLISPVPLSTLQARGVTIVGFETIIIDTSKRYLSPCFH
jgi:Ca2+-binding RTX toxin-like protein